LALFGMVQGAIGGVGLIRMFAPDADQRAPHAKSIDAAAMFQVLGLVAIVLIAAHGWRYAIGRFGIRAGLPEIRRLISSASSAPQQDRPEGAPILGPSHQRTASNFGQVPVNSDAFIEKIVQNRIC
jgi:hypothetical protein